MHGSKRSTTSARPSRCARIATWLAVALVCLSPLQAAPRIVAIGDVHGAYASFVAVLRAAGIVDAATAWSGGDARLVLLGDVLDRGAESRRALELVMRLQQQAVGAGGHVELVLGNHEVMNLIGDLRYVTAAELAAYAPEESADERDAAWQRFRLATGDTTDARARFDARYPPGFFGHRAAFAPGGRLGAWLLERPVLAIVDRTAFVHGGLPESLADRSLDTINREYAGLLRAYLDDVALLETAGVFHLEDDVGSRVAIADRYLAGAGPDAGERVRSAAERVRAFAGSPLLGETAVFWYRGTAGCSPAIEQARVDRTLLSLGADRVVIGHTPTASGGVSTRLAGRVVRADTGMLERYGGEPSAVIIDGGTVRALSIAAPQPTVPPAEARAVGHAQRGPTDDDIEALLGTAVPRSRATRADGTELWLFDLDGQTLRAVFRPVPRRGFPSLPEVAAYRLDRRLELNLVPVSVRRAIDGRVGALTFDTGDLPTESQRAAERAGGDAWCPLRAQFDALYAFDALASNPGRRPESVRYRTTDWALVLTDNETLFDPAPDLPAYLRNTRPEPPGWLATRLAALDERTLDALLGDVLDARRRAALLERRNKLLAR